VLCACVWCSTLLDELWYLTRHGQLVASWTHVPIPPLGASTPGRRTQISPGVRWSDQINPPYCLATNQTEHAPQQPKMPPEVDISQCLQVWAGPLSNNGTVVGLVNSCLNGTQNISTTWSELGRALPKFDRPRGTAMKCDVRDLYSGEDLAPATGTVSAMVGEHDIAVLRLTDCRVK
jgi:hypothetical protein